MNLWTCFLWGPVLVVRGLTLQTQTQNTSVNIVLPNDTQTLPNNTQTEKDPYEWLEDIRGKKQLKWVQAQNDRTKRVVVGPSKSPLLPKILDVLNSDDNIPWPVEAHGGKLYNFVQDKKHPRGLWRRTEFDEYKKPHPVWETLLDVDDLASFENKSWVWQDCVFLKDHSHKHKHFCLMLLSHSGNEAVEVREFNLETKKFEPPPKGFFLPEAKSIIEYKDHNTVFVGTDFGNNSLMDSGYPRFIREWSRGKKLSQAPVILEGNVHDILISAKRIYERHGFLYDWHTTSMSFSTAEHYVRVVSRGKYVNDFKFHHLEIPPDAEVHMFADQMLLWLKSDFKPTSKIFLTKGSLVATNLLQFLNGQRNEWVHLFEPGKQQSLQAFQKTKNYIVLNILDSLKAQLISWHYSKGGRWELDGKSGTKVSSVSIQACDSHATDALWISNEEFLQPTTLSLIPSAGNVSGVKPLKSLPALFNSSDLNVSQKWVRSHDGTDVPYFLIRHINAPKRHPTILYGYGGFDISLSPKYSPVLGRAWLEGGGVFALANIRGGGEFGPDWHHAALRKNKEKSYQDMAAVAQDLIATNVTSREQLGVLGSSNGGLLAANMFINYPQLFGAVVSKMPLLDLKRFNHLLDGPFYVEEYGDPDNSSDWEFLRKMSPYHNVDPKRTYPPVLFMTSTEDDRVSPAHARKMVMKIQNEVPGAKNTTFLYEDRGGHNAATAQQLAERYLIEFQFFNRVLNLDTPGLNVAKQPPQEDTQV